MNNNLNNTEKIQAARSSFTIYIQTEDRYYYAIIPADRILAFRKDSSLRKIDLTKYGKVVAHGVGKPSLNTMQEMEEIYGCNHEDAVLV